MSGEAPEAGGGQPPTDPPVAVQVPTSVHVFISYASQDVAVADAIVETLERCGIRCWIAPRDVTPGSHYADGIMLAISGAKALVLVLSDSALASKHVGKEVERASAKGRPIIALRMDTAPLTPGFEYFLSESQWIDVGTGGIPAVAATLVEAVRRHLDSSAAIALRTEKVVAEDSQTRARLDPRAAGRAATVPNRYWVIAALIVVLALFIGYLAVNKFWLSKQATSERPVAAVAPAVLPTAPAMSDKSVAVLPFVDMSEKKDQEYFADGTAEEILNLLAKVPGLHVPARTSSFYFKGKSEDIPTIARRLMVAHVLEGSVRKSGNRVRITVQLVRADNGYHVWSETYDRTLDDIFKVQDEIAAEVVKALKVSLGENEVPRAVTTKNPEAHALLLQARFYVNRGTKDDLARAVGYYQQMIQLEPDSAAAWAELSEALTLTWNSGFMPHGRTLQQQRALALQAAERAIAINPNLGEAHEALVEIYYWFDWDWAAAEAEVEKARALDPASTAALTEAGALALLHGQPSDALRLWEQAAAKDPLNSDAYGYLAEAHSVLGQFTEAEVAARKAADLNPIQPGSHIPLVRALLALGQQDAALAEIEKESYPGYRAYALARAYIVLGRRADAEAALSQLEKTFAADQPYNIAVLHALRGEHDQAFLWLDRAYKQHDPDLVGIPQFTIDLDMKNLRGDPRYKAFLREMNLPE